MVQKSGLRVYPWVRHILPGATWTEQACLAQCLLAADPDDDEPCHFALHMDDKRCCLGNFNAEKRL